MIYIRGHARDYDHWRQMGLTGWGYADVLPYFKRAQTSRRRRRCLERRRRPALRCRAARRAIRSTRRSSKPAAQAGYPVTRDFNGHQQEGVGPYHLTIRDGERWSAAAAYLRAGRRRAAEPESDHQRACGAHHHREQDGGGRRILGRAGQARAEGVRQARSAAVRRRVPVAASAVALGHRPGGRAEEARHPG